MKLPTRYFLLTIFLPFLISKTFGQTDLQILLEDPPTEVRIGSTFALTALVQFDAGGNTAVPTGEVITAVIQLKSPSGLVLASHTQNWNGFSTTQYLSNRTDNIDQVLFQVPWSEAQKWNSSALWTVTARVWGAASEVDVLDNYYEHNVSLIIPNLEVTGVNINQDPAGLIPGSELDLNVTVQNTSQVRTQEGVFFPLVVRLLNNDGSEVDRETLILPDPDGGITPSLEQGQEIILDVKNLRLPPDAQGSYTIEAEVDPPNLFQGQIVYESDETDNVQDSSAINVNSGNVDLKIMEDSFSGELGTFRGLDPVRLSFAVRNEGTRSISADESFTVQVLLSKDDSYSLDDFILREFDMGGNALGENLMPNETVSFDWIQQMPDNYEGDYYLLVRILSETNMLLSSSALENTPSITLISQDRGNTELVNESSFFPQNTERPHTSQDGRMVVYEQTDANGLQQIYITDILDMINPKLISRSFASSFSGGNSNSFRPRISADGNTVAFHSKASDIVPGDFNGHEDIFIYNVDTEDISRIVKISSNTEGNQGSFYPDLDHDGTVVVFESEATNLQSNGVSTTGRQIFLWENHADGSQTIRAITSGNSQSSRPTIDDAGKTIAFTSLATTNLANAYPTSSKTIDDNNSYSDVFVYNVDTNKTYFASINEQEELAQGGPSDQAEISGDGSTVVFRSMASNLVKRGGVAHVEVVNGGAGYFGNPTIEIRDESGGGSGAVLSLTGGIDAYGQILPNGITITQEGIEYESPSVTIIADPNQPAPTRDAKITVSLYHPEGDIYKAKVADLNGSSGSLRSYSERVSEHRQGRQFGSFIGANRPSRDPSISYDGQTIVYSTKSSNLLDDNVIREDGKTFYNKPFSMARARAILVGGIGEIEVQNGGSGYQSGFLKIEDYSGGGSGAVASYQVDTYGRISSITMVNNGADYDLNTTVVSVDNPRISHVKVFPQEPNRFHFWVLFYLREYRSV